MLLNIYSAHQLSLSSRFAAYKSLSIMFLINYFKLMKVAIHDVFALFGFMTFIIIVIQCLSGTMLSFSLVPEPMLVPMVRDEEDLEDLYIEDFFWLHERGVDLIFIFSYCHLFRKLYLNIFEHETEASWKSGVAAFLVLQVVVFLGLVLCCTHLSEITLTIAANIFHTFFLFKGKFYWWFFTDKQLNTDTFIRLAYAHYVSAFYLAFLGLLHGIDIHFDWKNDSFSNTIEPELLWWDEALSNELFSTFCTIFLLNILISFMYEEPEALSYEVFMWGDIGIVTDVRFYGVAPHWYFRPFMAWLIACPFHKTGILGLLLFFFLLYFQPNLHGSLEQQSSFKKFFLFFWSKFKKASFFDKKKLTIDINSVFQFSYWTFFLCAMYTTSFLPYGRFYNQVGGNVGMLLAYLFILCFLAFPFFRKSWIVLLYTYYIFYSSLNFTFVNSL